MVYSVDEVSERLDIPRPTLYRYLREYSIPHLRRAGKISIPEESFDRIREARELHREGLGTESVRRKLGEEGSDLDVEELAERLDRLSGALESLREDLKSANGTPGIQQEALQTLHEKQDALLSEVSRLHGLVEELSNTEGRLQTETLQREAPGSLEEIKEPEALSGESEERTGSLSQDASNVEEDSVRDGVAHEAVDKDPDPTTRMKRHDSSIREAYSKSGEPFVVFSRRRKFGALAEGRRRWVLALLVALIALVVIAVLVWALLAPGEESQEQASPEEPETQAEPQSVSEAGESPQTVEVPSLVGSTLQEAEEEIYDAGLVRGVVNEISSYAVPAGTVAAQEPAVGVEVDPDTPVNLVVSSGSPEAPGA